MRSPTRRAALAVCVALLLVTAGCSGGTAPTSTAPTNSAATPTTSTATTSTATATTTTGTWSPNSSVEQYPPGVAANGTLVNASTLVDAHFDATANQSMALTFETTGANWTSDLRYAHGANRTPYYSTLDRTTDGERVVQELYRTDSQDYVETALPNETRFSVLQNSTVGIAGSLTRDGIVGPRFELWNLLAGGNYSVNGTVERDGRTLVQLTADEVAASPPGFTTAYEGTALVTPDGIVYDVDASAGKGPDGTTEEHYESSVSLDTDVDWSGPPSWVSDIPHLSLSIVEDGHAVEIRNTGGAALPANASFDVLGANETVWGRSLLAADVEGTVTTDARLEPRDSVYVTAGSDGNSSSFALHDGPVRGNYTFGFAGLRGAHENVTYRLATGFKSDQND